MVKNKTFVITGDTETERTDLKSRIISLGGKVTVQPSSRTDFAVIGTSPGPLKIEKIKSLKIKKNSEKQLLRMLEKEESDITRSNIEVNINTLKSDNQLWTEKYRPQNEKDFLGNKQNFEKIKSFLTDSKKNCVLLSGLPGIGKTTAAVLVCKLLDIEYVEFNASDARNKEVIKKISTSTLGKNLKIVRKL